MNRNSKLRTSLLLLPLCSGLVFGAAKKKDGEAPGPDVNALQFTSKPLPAVAAGPAPKSSTTLAFASAVADITPTQPRDMRLLVVAATGTEPGFAALKFFLDHVGIPYRAVIRANEPLPALTTLGKGNFQGIILATGNLGLCDPTCRSALTAAEWLALDTYTRDYGVRTVAYYTYPEARYGMTALGGFSTDAAPAAMTFTGASANVFRTINRANKLNLRYAYYYAAQTVAAPGEVTTPLLTINNQTVGVLHTKADGREYMALNFDNNPYTIHSMALSFDILNWVTKGIFIGAKKSYFSPQNDDHFLPNDLFVFGVAACMPSGFTNEPTYDPADACPSDRMDPDDMKTIVDWQNTWNKKAQFSKFKITMAFNGAGASSLYGGLEAARDTLTSETIRYRNEFFWVNHTYDHENLDCFNPAPNSGICTPVTYNQALDEIRLNVQVALRMGLPLDTTAMVTPGISGLNRTSFLSAASAMGLRYLAGDLSRPEGQPASPNTGIRSALQPNILIVPRRATNIFYNAKSGSVGAVGSEPDEYNYFYGPGGVFRLANGAPFFSSNQSWAQIVDSESNALLNYMLRGELYPVMFHQSNFIRFAGSAMLFTDVVDAAFKKFSDITTMPVFSLSHSDTGRAMERRMAFNQANVTGTLYPGSRIEIRATGSATAPVTGICKTGCETYGGLSVSSIPVNATGVATITLP